MKGSHFADGAPELHRNQRAGKIKIVYKVFVMLAEIYAWKLSSSEKQRPDCQQQMLLPMFAMQR